MKLGIAVTFAVLSGGCIDRPPSHLESMAAIERQWCAEKSATYTEAVACLDEVECRYGTPACKREVPR